MIRKPIFERVWKASSEKQKKEVLDAIDKFNKERILKWIMNHEDIALGELSSRALKDIARGLEIVNYSRMTKSVLLTEIRRYGYEKK